MRKKAAERKAERVRIRASKMRREGFVNEHHQKDTDGKVIEHGDGTPSSVEEGAAWTKKEGKNKSGGLNEKGRKSYEAENPGSDLKAPSKKVGNPRRKSFCARMKGMRKRQKPSNNTGDDRLSKSLRAWNCGYEPQGDTINELNRYEKETGTSSGSINMPKGRPTQKGGTTSPVMRAVRTKIRQETGKPHGQQKKTKGEKGNRQYGDRKFPPADTIAKRRQSRADAETLMRDTRGT